MHQKITDVQCDPETGDVTFFFDFPAQTPFNAREFNDDTLTRKALDIIEGYITWFNERPQPFKNEGES